MTSKEALMTVMRPPAGLTKRELYAAMAMQGLCADFKNLYDADPMKQSLAEARETVELFAVLAVGLADTLIKELEKKP